VGLVGTAGNSAATSESGRPDRTLRPACASFDRLSQCHGAKLAASIRTRPREKVEHLHALNNPDQCASACRDPLLDLTSTVQRRPSTKLPMTNIAESAIVSRPKQGLIGKVAGVIGDTRTAKDFARFLDTLLSSAAANTRWDIVCDNLNIHLSESVVRLVGAVARPVRPRQDFRCLLLRARGTFGLTSCPVFVAFLIEAAHEPVAKKRHRT
jgi:hypothetical protein